MPVYKPTPTSRQSEHEDIDLEPFMLRDRSAEEVADYDAGFKAGSQGSASDQGKSDAWYRGWAEAQE